MKKGLLFLMLSVLTLGAWAQSSPNVVVADNINTYTGTDTYVFNKADGKIYVRNNANDYERYGIYEKVTSLKVAGESINQISYIATKGEEGTDNVPYLNTGYIAKANTRIVLDVDIENSTAKDWMAVFGARQNGWGNNAFVLFCRSNKDGAGNKGCYNRSGSEKPGTTDIPRGQRMTIDASGNTVTFTVNGSEVARIEANGTVENCTNNMYIFDTNTAGAGGNKRDNSYCFMKLYGCKIYEGETLVKDYVPVYNNSLAKGGVKDKLSGDVIYSSSSREFAVSDDAHDAGVPVYEGKMVYNTAEGKVYEYVGSSFVDRGAVTMEAITDTDYKNMKNWRCPDGHWESVFDGGNNIQWNEANQTNRFDPYVGKGGWEPLHRTINVTPDQDYNVSFKYSTGGWTTWNTSHTETPDPISLPFKIIDRESYSQNLGFYTDAGLIAYAKLTNSAVNQEPVSVDFTSSTSIARFIIQFGVVDDGEHNPAYWFSFDNWEVKKYIYPKAYPVLNPFGPEIEDLLPEVEAFDRRTTTDAIAALLDAAVTTAQASLDDPDDLAAQKEALENLEEKFELAKNNNVTILRATVILAKAEGVNTTPYETFLAEGLDGTSDQLNKLRMDRKAAHMQIDNATYTGNAPAAGEFYIYNVGRKNYLTSGGDWGTHAVLGWPGLLATLAENDGGYTIQFNELIPSAARDKYLGKGPYVDASNGDKGTFVFEAVSGKSGVYHIKCTNNSRYLGYDVNGHVDDGGQRTFDIVTHNWESADGNLDGEWMLVTKAERLAQMDNASTANPVDVTVLISDASFNKYAALDDPWTNLNQDWEWGDRNFGDKNTETFNSQEYDLSQTVTIPKAGYYELSVQSYYRDGNINAHVSRVQAGEELVVAPNLYAGSVTQPIMYIHEEADKAPGEGTNTNIGNFPDNMRQASKFFENGLYKKSLRFVVDADNTEVKIGIKKGTGNRDNNWVVTDNFRLTYLGGTIPTESVTVGSLSYATYASDTALDFTGSGIKAFYATESAGTLSFTQVNKVPANTGVLLYADGGATVNVPLTGTTDDVTGNVFVRGKGAAVTYADNDQNYILFNGVDGIGFYKANNNNVATNRAYIHVENDNGVKGFVINLEDDATGISLMEDGRSQMEDGAIYNVAGQRLSKTQKGINIVNGKKILK